jgi:hypothetical protein
MTDLATQCFARSLAVENLKFEYGSILSVTTFSHPVSLRPTLITLPKLLLRTERCQNRHPLTPPGGLSGEPLEQHARDPARHKFGLRVFALLFRRRQRGSDKHKTQRGAFCTTRASYEDDSCLVCFVSSHSLTTTRRRERMMMRDDA